MLLRRGICNNTEYLKKYTFFFNVFLYTGTQGANIRLKHDGSDHRGGGDGGGGDGDLDGGGGRVGEFSFHLP